MVDFKEFDDEEFCKDVVAFVSMGFSEKEAREMAHTAKLMKRISELTPDDKNAIYDSGIAMGNALKKPLKIIRKVYQKFLDNLYARLENEHIIEKLSDMMSHRVSEYKYSPKEIIGYLKDEWDYLTKEEQKKLGVLIAGRNQLNKFLVLMHNYDEIMDKEEDGIADEISDSHTVGKHDKLHYQALKENEVKDEMKKLRERMDADSQLSNAQKWRDAAHDIGIAISNVLSSNLSIVDHELQNKNKNDTWNKAEDLVWEIVGSLNEVDNDCLRNLTNAMNYILENHNPSNLSLPKHMSTVHGTGVNINNNNFNYGDDLVIDDSYIIRTTSEQVMIYKRLH